jgi:hypothetical protein
MIITEVIQGVPRNLFDAECLPKNANNVAVTDGVADAADGAVCRTENRHLMVLE